MEGSEIRGSSEAVLLTPRSGLDIYLAHEKRPCPRPRPRKRFRSRVRFRFRIPGSPDRIFTPLRRGDSFIFVRGSVGPGSLETFRGTASGIGATVGNSIYIYIYISPNYSRSLFQCRSYPACRRLLVGTLGRNRHFPSEFSTLSRIGRLRCRKCRDLPSNYRQIGVPPPGRPGSGNNIENSTV